MNCPACGAPLAEDARFCPRCGVRVDGKMPCPGCGREIDADAVFCTYCGARTDGKKVCPRCGQTYEGAACPACAAAGEPPQGAAPSARKGGAGGRTLFPAGAVQVMAVARQAVLYLALCALFICAFFVSFTFTAEAGASRAQGGPSDTFYFFTDLFTEVKAVLTALDVSGADYYAELEIALYVAAGLSAAAAAAVLCVCCGFFIAGTVAFVSAMKKGREVRMSKYVIAPAVVSLALVLFLKSLYTFEISTDGARAGLSLGAAPVAAIAIVASALGVAAVLHVLADPRTAAASALRYAVYGAGAVLACVLLCVLPSALVRESDPYRPLEASVGVAAPLLFFGVLAAIGSLPSGSAYDALLEFLPDTAVAFGLYTLLMVLAAAALYVFAAGIVRGHSLVRAAGACVLGCLAAAASLAYLVFGVRICDAVSGVYSLGSSAVGALVLSLLTLAAAVGCICALRKKGQTVPPQEPASCEPSGGGENR